MNNMSNSKELRYKAFIASTKGDISDFDLRLCKRPAENTIRWCLCGGITPKVKHDFLI